MTERSDAPSTLDVLSRLQASASPTEDEAMDAVVPAAMWREFVDMHARLLYESARNPAAAWPFPKQRSEIAASVPAETWRCPTCSALCLHSVQPAQPCVVDAELVKRLRQRAKILVSAGWPETAEDCFDAADSLERCHEREGE